MLALVINEELFWKRVFFLPKVWLLTTYMRKEEEQEEIILIDG